MDERQGTGARGERRPSRMADRIGPCCTAASMGRALGCSEDDITELVEAGRLLALTTADGYVVFPAFQLHNGQIAPGLPIVLKTLREGIDDPWTWALWLNSTAPGMEGMALELSRIQQLIAGEFDLVLRAAERSASSWRS